MSKEIEADVKVDHKRKQIIMYGKELIAKHQDEYLKFLSHLVIRNQNTGQNYDILLK